MVKKLLKHEFIYYIRTLAIALPIIIVVGLITRLFLFLHDGSIVTTIAVGSSVLMLYLGSLALLLFTQILNIVRFYKNMYSAEGYLTFTLPVTNRQHIFVKLLASVLAMISCVVAIVISALIALSGEPLVEIGKALIYVFGNIFKYLPTGHLVFYAIEILLLLIIGTVSVPLFYYTCISIGQTAKKNRILMAVVVYFVFYFITQVLTTIFMIVFTMLGTLGAFDALFEFVAMYPFAFMHIIMWISIIVSGALNAAFYFVTLRIMNRKLNLE